MKAVKSKSRSASKQPKDLDSVASKAGVPVEWIVQLAMDRHNAVNQERFVKERTDEQEQVKALLESFEMVYRFEGVGTHSVESLGFNKDGRLVFFDGHEIRPITPRGACEWLAEMSRFCGRFVLDQTSCDEGTEKFFALLAAKLPEGGAK